MARTSTQCALLPKSTVKKPVSAFVPPLRGCCASAALPTLTTATAARLLLHGCCHSVLSPLLLPPTGLPLLRPPTGLPLLLPPTGLPLLLRWCWRCAHTWWKKKSGASS